MNIEQFQKRLTDSLQNIDGANVPTANFSPVWINNITRLNAQNLNEKMYKSIDTYVQGYGDAVFRGSNSQLSNLLTILPGYKVSDDNPSEIHNIEADLSSTNKALGNYQTVFGKNNITDPETNCQFVIGQFANAQKDYLFCIGNGDNTQNNNAISVTSDGSLIVQDSINTTNDSIFSINGYNNSSYISLGGEARLGATMGSEGSLTFSSYYNDDNSVTRITLGDHLLNLHSDNINNRYVRLSGIADATTEHDAVNLKQLNEMQLPFADVYTGEANVNDVKQDVRIVSLTLPRDGEGTNSAVSFLYTGDVFYVFDTEDVIKLGSPVSNINTDNSFVSITQYNTKLLELKHLNDPTELGDATSKHYVDNLIKTKQDVLVSGTNIKTVNGTSLLGEGNIIIEGGGSSITIDSQLSDSSENPVQNKVITTALNNKLNKATPASGFGVPMIKSDGTETLVKVAGGGVTASAFMLTTPTGAMFVGTPTVDNHATNKKYVDEGLSGKLDKVTTTASLPRVYAVLADGSQSIIEIADTILNNSMARRTTTGTLRGAPPTDNTDLTPKAYVDNLVSNKILVSETQPENPIAGAVWIQPLESSTGSVDFIVEQGNTTTTAQLTKSPDDQGTYYSRTINWTWRKWNSGLFECWGNTDVFTTDNTEAQTTGYRYSNNVIELPFSPQTVEYMNVNGHGGTQACWAGHIYHYNTIHPMGDPDKKNIIFDMFSFAAVNEGNMRTFAEVKGTWKVSDN